MADDPRKHLLSLLNRMASLSPWNDVGDPEAEPFRALFAATREKALAAAPAYAAAVSASHDKDLEGWLGDMSALRRWADEGNPEAAPFVAAFAAARGRALAAAQAMGG